MDLLWLQQKMILTFLLLSSLPALHLDIVSLYWDNDMI